MKRTWGAVFAVSGCRILLEKFKKKKRWGRSLGSFSILFYFFLLLKPFFPRRLTSAATPLITSHLHGWNAKSATLPVYTRRARQTFHEAVCSPVLPSPLILRRLSRVLLSLWFRADWIFYLEHMLNTPRTAAGGWQVRWMFLDLEHASCGWMVRQQCRNQSQKRCNLYTLESPGFYKGATQNLICRYHLKHV